MNDVLRSCDDKMDSCPVDVSVIIPCFNAEKYIQRTLESVFRQRGVSFEVVLVDDGCADRSIDIVRDGFPDVLVYSHENRGNRGYAASVNLGMAKARGRYFAFIDADDIWLVDTYLVEQIESLEKNPCAVLSLCNGFAVDSDDKLMWKWNDDSVFNDCNKRTILQNCFMLTGATVVRRSAMAVVGWFNTLLQSADHDMWIRLSEIGEFAYSAKAMLGYRQHPGQISSRRRQWEDGFDILKGVQERGYYTGKEIRMRKAVLHFRLALHDKSESAYLSMLMNGMLSFCYDPARAVLHTTGLVQRFLSRVAGR